jgi:hypothetical protein
MRSTTSRILQYVHAYGLRDTLPAAWDLIFEESLLGDFMGK